MVAPVFGCQEGRQRHRARRRVLRARTAARRQTLHCLGDRVTQSPNSSSSSTCKRLGRLHRSKELLVVFSYLNAVPKKMWIPTDQVSQIRKIKFAGDKVKFARRRIRFPLQLWLPEALFCEFLHWREKCAAVARPSRWRLLGPNLVTGTEGERRFNKRQS